MRDLWCYFKSVFISTLKLIGKSFFSAFLLFLLHTFSVIDRAGITWHIADPFHKRTYLLPQLLSLAYFVSQKNFTLKASMKVAKYCTLSAYFWGADRRTNIRPIILSCAQLRKGPDFYLFWWELQDVRSLPVWILWMENWMSAERVSQISGNFRVLSSPF